MTFNNDLEHDLATLERFHEFREEAERKGFRYFLEVFDPNVPGAVAPEILPRYINDMITRMLAGVAPGGPARCSSRSSTTARRRWRSSSGTTRTSSSASSAARPGTTRDAFQLLHDAQKYGAKVALFGRKINNAENQLAFVQFLRLIVDGVIGPVEAVKAYHAVLGKLGHPAPSPARRRPEAQPTVDELRRDDHDSVSRPAPADIPRQPRRMPASATDHAPAPAADAHACACQATSPIRCVGRTASPPPPTAAPTSPGWMPRSAWRIIGKGWVWDREPIRSGAGLAPIRVVIEREEPLDGLGAAGAGLEQGLDRLPQLGEAPVGMLAHPAGGAVEPVQRRGDLQDAAPRLQEVSVEHLGRFARVDHGGLDPTWLPDTSRFDLDRGDPTPSSQKPARHANCWFQRLGLVW